MYDDSEKRRKILNSRNKKVEERKTTRVMELRQFFERNPVVKMWALDLKEHFGSETNAVKVVSFSDGETRSQQAIVDVQNP
jgi:hypothetical protein